MLKLPSRVQLTFIQRSASRDCATKWRPNDLISLTVCEGAADWPGDLCGSTDFELVGPDFAEIERIAVIQSSVARSTCGRLATATPGGRLLGHRRITTVFWYYRSKTHSFTPLVFMYILLVSRPEVWDRVFLESILFLSPANLHNIFSFFSSFCLWLVAAIGSQAILLWLYPGKI